MRASRRWRRAVALGLGVGALGIILGLSPAVHEVEEAVGLGALFAVRGAVPPPDNVAVVNVSVEAAAALGQSPDLDEWDRSLHAAVIDRLVEWGAAVIVFDMSFDRPRSPDADRRLHKAVQHAGNVILFERVETDTLPIGGGGAAVIETRIAPLPELETAALATAPFTLPSVPLRVGQFWTFGRHAGGAATLPAVALQAYLLPHYDAFVGVLAGLDSALDAQLPATLREVRKQRNLDAVVAQIRDAFRREPGLERQARARLGAASADAAAALAPLIGLYAGRNSRYLNFYGPARTIATIPYDRVVHAAVPPAAVAGRVVFVGYSERRQMEQQDRFHSVFSERSGQQLSGVEILATAFANLSRQTGVVPASIPQHLAVVLAWGLLLGLMLVLLPLMWGNAAALAAGALYAAGAYRVFAADELWLPTVVPLLVQLPVALVGAALWHYGRMRLQRERVRAVLGFYVPLQVADRLAHETLDARAAGELVHGTCLFTDAEQYTALAEAMQPQALSAFMNDYYQALFGAVARHAGEITDVAGDSMVATWTAATVDPRCSLQACRAALDISLAVREFNAVRGWQGLNTRIGLESGEVYLGNIGAGDRFEYRAVGDIVNTAARIQALNRLLNTQVLVSGDALPQVPGLLARDVGTFVLRGKSKPSRVHELVGIGAEQATADTLERYERFAAALEDFRLGRFPAAATRFTTLLHRYPDDGPSRYYLSLCRRYAVEPPAGWEGVVVLAVK